jgi:hypothetical protein
MSLTFLPWREAGKSARMKGVSFNHHPSIVVVRFAGPDGLLEFIWGLRPGL